jgi:UDP-N-acetylmuramyl pentapeptide phosphotransferase/UDP-N-acetylglucosamine-1-phosphate transferase
LILALIALIAFAASAVSTRALIPWLQSRGAVATENDRTMHSGVIPKGGGLPLLLSSLLTVLCLAGFSAFDRALILGTAILAILSWYDDLAPLPPLVRFPVHIACAALFVLSLPADALIFQGWLPFAIDRAAAIFALTWMLNLYNFMDGINGIAGVETLAITAGYLLTGKLLHNVQPFEPIAAALLGATAGFLIWNLRKRALVFMGDAGSVPSGFITGALMIDLAVRGQWAAALILPAFFLTDATITLLKRIARGEKPWEAHRSHFYQRAAAAWGSHMAVVGAVAVLDLALIACAAASIAAPWFALAAAGICLGIALYTLNK